MMRGRDWGLLAFGVAGLALLWHVATVCGARSQASVEEGEPAGRSVVRASAFVLEDAEGVERGRLALDGGEMVLDAFGDGEGPQLQVRLVVDGSAPRLTVSSPPNGSIAILAVGETGAQPWFGLRGEIDGTTPDIILGVQSRGPMIALHDEDGPRVMLSSFMHSPALCLYDDAREIFWQTPRVPGWEEKYGPVMEERRRRAEEAMEEETRARLKEIEEMVQEAKRGR